MLIRLGIGVEKKNGNMIAFIPDYRKDLNIVEDLADEVGRLYDVNKISPVILPPFTNEEKINSDSTFSLCNFLRSVLLGEGFSEVYGYTFSSVGELEVEKPLAEDRSYLRTNLSQDLREKLRFNLRNSIFDNEPIKIFEIGSVFKRGKEAIHLAVAVGFKNEKFKKTAESLNGNIIPEDISKWGSSTLSDEESEIVEIDVDDLLDKIDWEKTAELSSFIKKNIQYKQFSSFPFILRDIAIFVPENVGEQDIMDIIEKEGGQLLVRKEPFDVFKKQFPDGETKVSHAFKLVFQSMSKTLSDDEVNDVMDQITKTLNSKNGWQVR